MTRWGILLIVLGVGSLLLPAIGWNFRVMELVDDYQPWAGTIVTIVGVALVSLPLLQSSEAAPSATPSQPVGNAGQTGVEDRP